VTGLMRLYTSDDIVTCWGVTYKTGFWIG
jgi:hypothetical protein